jgi:hypothetical protein
MNLKSEKGLGPFSPRRPNTVLIPGPTPRVSRPASCYRATVTDRWGLSVGAPNPPTPHPRVVVGRIPVVEPATRRVLTPPQCPLVVVSHRIASSCRVASRRCCPLLSCCPSLRQPGCPRQELDDEASHRLPRWPS